MSSPLTKRQRHVNALSAVKPVKPNNRTAGNNAFLARYKASLARHLPPPPRPSKWPGVKKALMIEGMKKYTAEPNNILKYPYLAKLLKNRMKEFPITTNAPLYRGVGAGHNKTILPNKGVYATNKFRSFSKNIRVASKFAGPHGTILVLAPGTYPAININNYAKTRFPVNRQLFEPMNTATRKKFPNFPQNLINFISTAYSEKEVLFHPATWEIGNRRNNIVAPKGQVVKNIKLRRT
jgi:hypothetical protein